eukprot:SAG22_NODE_9400_length_591_cov_1.644309_1_plen_42_part_10
MGICAAGFGHSGPSGQSWRTAVGARQNTQTRDLGVATCARRW